MGTSPFEQVDGAFRVLANNQGQYSLWPLFAPVPDGWRVAHEADTRDACVAHIERFRTDMGPAQ